MLTLVTLWPFSAVLPLDPSDLEKPRGKQDWQLEPDAMAPSDFSAERLGQERRPLLAACARGHRATLRNESPEAQDPDCARDILGKSARWRGTRIARFMNSMPTTVEGSTLQAETL